MSDNDDDDDSVGYGKPPKAHRFKPGKSGNPKGRPRGARSVTTTREYQQTLVEFLAKEGIPVTVNGKSKNVVRLDILFQALYKAALEKNPRAIRLLLNEFKASIPYDHLR